MVLTCKAWILNAKQQIGGEKLELSAWRARLNRRERSKLLPQIWTGPCSFYVIVLFNGRIILEPRKIKPGDNTLYESSMRSTDHWSSETKNKSLKQKRSSRENLKNDEISHISMLGVWEVDWKQKDNDIWTFVLIIDEHYRDVRDVRWRHKGSSRLLSSVFYYE